MKDYHNHGSGQEQGGGGNTLPLLWALVFCANALTLLKGLHCNTEFKFLWESFHIYSVISSNEFPFWVTIVIVCRGIHRAELAAAGLLPHSLWLHIPIRSLTSFELSPTCIVRLEWGCSGGGCSLFFNKAYVARGTHIRTPVLQVKTVILKFHYERRIWMLGFLFLGESFHVLDKALTLWWLWDYFGGPFLTKTCYLYSSTVEGLAEILCYISAKSKILLWAKRKHNVWLHLNATGGINTF